MRPKHTINGIAVALLLASTPILSGEERTRSRAAWWLAQDKVDPIADMVNIAGPGRTINFVDRIGSFSVRSKGRALFLSGIFPSPNIWRFDLTTFRGQFDMRRLYRPIGMCAFPQKDSLWTRRFTQLLADPGKGLTYTGPWEIFQGNWFVPTARVALDGQHVYTSWFDLPSLEDQAAGRVYASFALEITSKGRHVIQVSFDDFSRHTRWRPSRRRPVKPKITYCENPLRPHHIESIAIGIDERVRMIPHVKLRPALRGKHSRLPRPIKVKGNNLGIEQVEKMLFHVDPDRGALWEYSGDAESMASENDMDSGKHAVRCAKQYDSYVNHLSPDARKKWERLYLKRFRKYYTFFVFQRNYHPTGYAQNHSAATVIGLLYAGAAWDGTEGEKWLNWAIMICRKRVQLLGKDGGLEFMNESRSYGLRYFEPCMAFIKEMTGLDITKDEPFFENEWRYALHLPLPRKPG